MNTRSIYVRLITWYGSLTVLVALVFAAYTYLGVERYLHADMKQTLMRRAHEIERNMLAHYPANSQADIARQIEAVYTPEANDRFIRILAEDGRIFYRSGNPKDKQFNAATIPFVTEPGDTVLPIGKHALQLFTLPAEVNGRKYLIQMGTPTDQTDAALHGLIVTLLYGLPVIIFLVSAGGYLLAKRALLPVERIRAKAQSITFGNLSSRLPVATSGDPIEHLSVTLNQMLDRLENTYEQANRFSADASHELRTPLSIMRTELETLLQRPTLASVDREAVGIILEETERLSHITEHLFSMSRLDAGKDSAHEPVDMADIAKTTVEQMMPLAQEKSLTLTDETQKAIVSGNGWRLKQIVVNLLDNAIKYTPLGGRVHLRLKSHQHQAILEVSDTGIGIPAEALPHVFERFYRASKVRSRSEGGAGLGLSIVRSIVQTHGGTVEIESTEGKGTLCRITIPTVSGKENKA